MATTITFIPEINWWINRILSTTTINQQMTYIPVQLESEWYSPGSPIDILCNYTFQNNDYSIYYKKVLNSKITDKNITQRIIIKAGQIQSYGYDSTAVIDTTSDIFDTTNTGVSMTIIPDLPGSIDRNPDTIFDNSDIRDFNIFQITVGEKQMLDLLLDFRMNRPVDLTKVIYNDLTSSLSKLIYIYLDLEINNNYENYNSQNPINHENRLLSWVYEKWVLEHYYRRLKFRSSESKGSYFGETNCASQTINITTDMVTSECITFNEENYPRSKDYIYLIYNNQPLVYDTDYTYILNIDDTTGFSDARIDWKDLALEVEIRPNTPMYLLWSYNEPIL